MTDADIWNSRALSETLFRRSAATCQNLFGLHLCLKQVSFRTHFSQHSVPTLTQLDHWVTKHTKYADTKQSVCRSQHTIQGLHSA